MRSSPIHGTMRSRLVEQAKGEISLQERNLKLTICGHEEKGPN
jgi:hypothetical protein